MAHHHHTRRLGTLVVHREGVKQHLWDDLYHYLIIASWPGLLVSFISILFLFNTVFAVLYLLGGDCITSAEPGSFWDYFFFSVQTLATIGYGAMAPKTFYAHFIVSIEAMTGLFVLAFTTSITFSKFSRPTAKVLFSHRALVTLFQGKEMLILRVGNVRSNQIVDANVHLYFLRNEISPEGVSMRRFYEMKLERNSSPIFAMSWTIMHPIDKASPLHGMSLDDLKSINAEILVSLDGVDGDFSQNVYARHLYKVHDLHWGGMFEDVISTNADGSRTIDFSRFHQLRKA